MVKTTNQYWDCECDQSFLHSANDTLCIVCMCERENQPDARVNEVLAEGLKLVTVSCSYCAVTTNQQTSGDGCHACMKGTMQ